VTHSLLGCQLSVLRPSAYGRIFIMRGMEVSIFNLKLFEIFRAPIFIPGGGALGCH
jgi:hypothetical protein